MKKQILLIAALFGLSLGANAQFKMATNVSAGNLLETLPNGDSRFTVNFNTDKAVFVKAQTQKGVQVCVFNDLGAEVNGFNGKVNNYGGNGNFLHVDTISKLLDYNTVVTEKPWSSKQNFWKPEHLLIDNGSATDQAFAAYPGIYKKVLYSFCFGMAGYGLNSDISLEMKTFDIGNTTKQATYKMMVGIDADVVLKDPKKAEAATSADNTATWYVVDNIYTTSATAADQNLKKINVAEAIGLNPSAFNGKKVYILFYTAGTGTSIQHGIYEPIVAFDNMSVTYGVPSWIVPTVAKADVNIGYNDSVAIQKPVNVESEIKFNLQDAKRAGIITIQEDASSAFGQFSFAETGAIKAKDANGQYTIDVPYTRTMGEKEGSPSEILTIPAPTSGLADDDLEITMKVTPTALSNIMENLEITNGVRFRYQFFVQGVEGTGIQNPALTQNIISSNAGKIYVAKATGDVEVVNLAGVVLKTVSADAAASGIAVDQGAYIVKVADVIEKVSVK